MLKQMSQYSFIDYNYFNKDESDKNIYNVQKDFKNIEDLDSLNKGILDPNISIIPIKDVVKGV